MDKNNSPIAEALRILTEADKYFKELLKDNPSVQLLVCTGVLQIRNRLAGMIGAPINDDFVVEHQPITNFMGDEITYGRKIEKADLTADEADMEAYREKVRQLYEQFDTITPAGLVHNASIPEEQLVIRGVAKMAGVEDFEDREIDEDFIEDIAIAIKQKAADTAQQAAIDKQLSEGNTPPAGITDPNESENEEEDEEGVVEGDEQKAADTAQQVDNQPAKRGRKPNNPQ